MKEGKSPEAPRHLETPPDWSDTIGKYVVQDRLGQEGAIHVFRGLHPTLGTEVVIKLGRKLQPAESAPEEIQNQLTRDARALAGLEQPGLARLHDAGIHEDRLFVVLDNVPGQSLREQVRRTLPDIHQVMRWLVQAARAVSALHQRSVLHRALKPQFIVIDESGQPWVTNQGVALLDGWNASPEPLQQGAVNASASLDTPAYLAPEQARGEKDAMGPHSDVFSLGATLYFLLTGKPPFAGDNFSASLQLAQTGEFDSVLLNATLTERAGNLASPLEACCLKALAFEPRQRHPSAEALARELETLAGSHRRRWWLLGFST